MSKYRTHITIHKGEDCPFTVSFYKDDEYTGEACGALSLSEAMFISDLYYSNGKVDWPFFYKWLERFGNW